MNTMKTFLFYLILQLICLVSCQFCEKNSICSENSVYVTTKLGTFIGNNEIVYGVTLNTFKGIRFAEPPVGPLRFLDPIPITEPWKELQNVTTYGQTCARSKVTEYDEDCLFLNIWVPETRTSAKPVMVFVHGGSFTMGYGSERSGAALASRGDVVVVTFNYRLGFFGFFLSDVTKDIGSNMGIKDQLLVLKWIQENIKYFGGDPDDVTLFGHSAGGISVGMHLLSPLSIPYFKQAIIQSGTPYSFLRPDTLQVATEKSIALAKFLGCSSEKEVVITSDALECLRTKSAKEILVYGSEQPMHSLILPNPVYGDNFFPKRADIALKEDLGEQKIPARDVIIGVEQNEGESFVTRKLNVSSNFSLTFEMLHEYNHKLYDGKLSEEEQSQVFDYYFKHLEYASRDELVEQLFRAYADLYVYCPSYFYAKLYTGHNSNVLMYSLNFKLSQGDNPDCIGVCHGEELPIVFGLPFLDPERYTDLDRELSGEIIKYWTTFAKGQPLESEHWSTFVNSHETYNSIYASDIKQENEKFYNCDNFWKGLFDAR